MITEPWDISTLAEVPASQPATGFGADGVEGIFFDGVPWRGRPTRVFAWLGIPKTAQKCPGIVLVHGGGGTAFEQWVRLWTQRGYAAIAIDTCGCTAGGEHMHRPRHALGGPPGWGGCLQVDDPIEDQWAYHAVAGIILAGSLVRSLPQVDSGRIGLTGISWGGWLSCIAAGIDQRLGFVVPVYGCSVLAEEGLSFPAELGAASPRQAQRWRDLWDPSRFLSQATMPMLWVSGPNDFAFPLSSLQRSSRLPAGPRTLCVPVGMKHGHEEGWALGEIDAFADGHFRGGAPLARIAEHRVCGRALKLEFESERPIVRAEVAWTADRGDWTRRQWHIAAGRVDGSRALGAAPAGASAAYLNLIDDRNLLVSSEYAEFQE